MSPLFKAHLQFPSAIEQLVLKEIQNLSLGSAACESWLSLYYPNVIVLSNKGCYQASDIDYFFFLFGHCLGPSDHLLHQKLTHPCQGETRYWCAGGRRLCKGELVGSWPSAWCSSVGGWSWQLGSSLLQQNVLQAPKTLQLQLVPIWNTCT